MFPVRLMFVLLSTTMIYNELAFGQATPNDKIDVVLSAIMETNRKVDSLTEKVEDIARLEEETSGHVAKLEFEMEDVKNQVSSK